MRTGIFVGSFDPFTTGHASVVRRVLPLFDRVVIGVGVNGSKTTMLSDAERVDAIRRIYRDEPRVSVEAYSCLTVDFAQRHDAQYVVKGVRNVRDFEYEREQADINRQIGHVETLLLVADARYASISSSMVRELLHFGRDVSEFLPR